METIYKGVNPGTEIVDSQGHSVGTVHEVICNDADQLQMLTVQRGLLFKHDIGIPAVSIDRVAGGKIHLCVEKSTLSELLRPDPAKEPAVPSARSAPDANADTALLQERAVDRLPDQAQIRPGTMHDVGTGDMTHDMGIGAAGVPGVGSGNPAMVTGGIEGLNPTGSQEPAGKDRT